MRVWVDLVIVGMYCWYVVLVGGVFYYDLDCFVLYVCGECVVGMDL